MEQICTPVQLCLPCRERAGVTTSRLRRDSTLTNAEKLEVELSFEFDPRVQYMRSFSVTCFAKVRAQMDECTSSHRHHLFSQQRRTCMHRIVAIRNVLWMLI